MTSKILKGHTLSEVCLESQREEKEMPITSLVEATNNKSACDLVLVDAGLHDDFLGSLVTPAITRKIQHHGLVCDLPPSRLSPQCDNFLNLCKASELFW